MRLKRAIERRKVIARDRISTLTPLFGVVVCLAIDSRAAAQIALPPHFSREVIADNLVNPVAIAFADDGRLFVAEQRGVVRVFVNGVEQPQFFIDLRDEVTSDGFRGLLGIALDPGFLTNRRVYLAYTVDPIPGEPDEPDSTPTFNRLTRYTGSQASGGNVANLNSRLVLLGETPSEGIAACWAHTINAIRFGSDGSLLVAAGDGGHYEFADAGGNDPGCFQPPLFDPALDLGAFRAQSLDAMNGKILRLDPATGGGLPSNPWWDGDPFSARSRVWASGLRNPFRFCVRPDAKSSEGGALRGAPGAIFIGDVGWNSFEELNVSIAGGDNFGWPCFEGFDPAPRYPNLTPAASGCDTIETPANPGPLTAPLAAWHHHEPSLSTPAGVIGANAIGGAFYTGDSYPIAYRGALFYADFVHGWINVLRVENAQQMVNSFGFATSAGGPVDIVADPVTGDLCYVSLNAASVYRITYSGPGPGDLNGDGAVGVADLLQVITAWGPCVGGPAICLGDINGDGTVGVADLLLVIAHWG